MKLSHKIRLFQVTHDSTSDDSALLDDLYRLALKAEDAERDVVIKSLKDLQGVASKFFRAGKEDRQGRKVKYTGTVYIRTNGIETDECGKNYMPKKDEAVFQFSTISNVIVTPLRWSAGNGTTIEQSDKSQ